MLDLGQKFGCSMLRLRAVFQTRVRSVVLQARVYHATGGRECEEADRLLPACKLNKGAGKAAHNLSRRLDNITNTPCNFCQCLRANRNTCVLQSLHTIPLRFITGSIPQTPQPIKITGPNSPKLRNQTK
eukprot:2122156-Amphidinium_carterae.1